jgi:hypothetical protein
MSVAATILACPASALAWNSAIPPVPTIATSITTAP